MLTGISVFDGLGVRTLILPVGNEASLSPYLVTEVDGLGPVKAEILSTTFSSYDGANLTSLRTGSRNLVFNIRYRPGYGNYKTVEELRRELYRVFPPKNTIDLRFDSNKYPTVQIRGIVESNEPVIFSKEPEVQISVLCGEPNFFVLNRTSHSGDGTAAGTKPPYSGSAGTGFLLDITLKASASSITISNGIQDDIVFNGTLTSGNRLLISTEKGNKYVTVVRNGVYSNMLEGLAKGDLSMIIEPRVRVFSVTASNKAALSYQLTYVEKHMGL